MKTIDRILRGLDKETKVLVRKNTEAAIAKWNKKTRRIVNKWAQKN